MNTFNSTHKKQFIALSICALFFSGCSGSSETTPSTQVIQVGSNNNATPQASIPGSLIDTEQSVVQGAPVTALDPVSVDNTNVESDATTIDSSANAEPTLVQDPLISMPDPVFGDTASINDNLMPGSTCDGLLHPNGVTYCVDESTRRFSATLADGSVWWSFVLPGDNANNLVVAIIPINDNVALIANKAPNTPENSLYVENERFEISFFEPAGRFIDTRRLLPVPSNGRFVAVCGDSDRCSTGLGTHEFDRNPDSDEWSLVRFVINSSPVSGSTITADNIGALVEILDEISDGQTLVSPLNNRSAEVTASLDSLLQIANSSPSPAVRTYECPLSGTVERVGSDGSSQSRYVTPAGNGLVSTSSFNMSQFSQSTSERTLSVSDFEYASSTGGGSVPSQNPPFNGWPGVTPDGRTGIVRTSIDSTRFTNLSYAFEDSRFAEDSIRVDITLEDTQQSASFELDEGGLLPEQDITLLLTAPDDVSQLDVEFQLREADSCDIVCGRGWSGGSISISAGDGSRAVITLEGDNSALGRLQVFTDSGSLPAQSLLIDLTQLY